MQRKAPREEEDAHSTNKHAHWNIAHEALMISHDLTYSLFRSRSQFVVRHLSAWQGFELVHDGQTYEVPIREPNPQLACHDHNHVTDRVRRFGSGILGMPKSGDKTASGTQILPSPTR